MINNYPYPMYPNNAYPMQEWDVTETVTDGTAKATFVIVRIEGATPTNTVETTPHR